MLDERDIKKISEEVANVIEQNVNPQFEDLRKDIGELRAAMVTKTYLDEKTRPPQV